MEIVINFKNGRTLLLQNVGGIRRLIDWGTHINAELDGLYGSSKINISGDAEPYVYVRNEDFMQEGKPIPYDYNILARNYWFDLIGVKSIIADGSIIDLSKIDKRLNVTVGDIKSFFSKFEDSTIVTLDHDGWEQKWSAEENLRSIFHEYIHYGKKVIQIQN